MWHHWLEPYNSIQQWFFWSLFHLILIFRFWYNFIFLQILVKRWCVHYLYWFETHCLKICFTIVLFLVQLGLSGASGQELQSSDTYSAPTGVGLHYNGGKNKINFQDFLDQYSIRKKYHAMRRWIDYSDLSPSHNLPQKIMSLAGTACWRQREKRWRLKWVSGEKRGGLRGAVPLRCRCGTELRVCLGKEVAEGQEVQT